MDNYTVYQEVRKQRKVLMVMCGSMKARWCKCSRFQINSMLFYIAMPNVNILRAEVLLLLERQQLDYISLC